MKRTVYLPQELGKQVERYLREHQGETFSSFMQRAVEEKLALDAPTDYGALLSLAGFVKEGPASTSERPEDEVALRDSLTASA